MMCKCCNNDVNSKTLLLPYLTDEITTAYTCKSVLHFNLKLMKQDILINEDLNVIIIFHCFSKVKSFKP